MRNSFQISNLKFQIVRGFTLVELLLVMGMMAVLLGLITVNLVGVQHQASIASTVNLVVSDLKQQQIKAMVGSNGGISTASPSGIFFGSTSYTLFTGAVYSPTDAGNFDVDLASGWQFTDVTFPSSSLIFASGSGKVAGFSPTANSFRVQNLHTSEGKSVQLNQYGVVTSIN